jgi:enterochelin esterase-like enzyme
VIVIASLVAIVCRTVSAAPELLRPGPEPQWVTPVVEGPRLSYGTFHSGVAGTEVSYHVYVPEAYDRQTERRFPVLYYLHGHRGGLDGFAFLAHHFDGGIRSGAIPPMLAVFPNGMYEGMWCDWKSGKGPIETVVISELIPHIDATYRTMASREGRMIEGYSMGGYGAARLGFKYPELFGGVSILAGGPLQHVLEEFPPRVSPQTRARVMRHVYGNDIEYFKTLSPWELAQSNAAALSEGTLIRVQIGEQDEMLDVTRQFVAHLTGLCIPHSFEIVPGVGHQPGRFLQIQAGNDDYWAFYREALAP